MRKIALLILILSGFQTFAQQSKIYEIYNKEGKKTSYKKLLKKAARVDVVFFGEEHDNNVAHWLELKLTEDLYDLKKGKIILGAEMFERDNQSPLTDYVEGRIDAKKLDSLARLWPNFEKDYKPLVDFAKNKNLKFIATNIPRRYANLVYRKDFSALDSLSEEEKKWIAPLPVAYDSTLSQYVKMREMLKKHGHDNPNLPKAQAIKDATMAYFIYKNLKPGYTFIHFNGSFHSAFDQGIIWYLKKLEPKIKILTIETVSQKDIGQLEEKHKGTADFIIVIDDSFPKSY